MNKYLVTGATGTIGSHVVTALIKENQAVRAGSRNPQKSKALWGNDTEHVALDFENPETYDQALEGIDGVFLLGPPLNLGLYELLEPFVDHIITNGPKRIVYLSAYGNTFMEGLSFHARMEEKLKDSPLDWRVIRPGFLHRTSAIMIVRTSSNVACSLLRLVREKRLLYPFWTSLP